MTRPNSAKYFKSSPDVIRPSVILIGILAKWLAAKVGGLDFPFRFLESYRFL